MSFLFKKSLALYKEAMKYIPAGVGSNARLWHSAICQPGLPCSLFVKKAKGAYVWDVDSNKYIDYRLGYGPVILGHDNEKIHKAVEKAEELGTVYAAGHELEITVAKKIISMVPCAEMVRFSTTGTEATMTAVRLARAFTKRDKIIKFEGHFHGTHDYVLWSTAPPFTWPSKDHNQPPHQQSLGIPKAIRSTIIIEKWNDFDAIEKTVKENYKNVAAIITEPIMGNAAAIMPKKGYLKHLRELCDKYGIVLIFDEVKTGFRVARGGAQELFGVKPDIATLAKAMGNGYPVSAVVGKKEIMHLIYPGGVSHGGTYSSNPMSLAAANAVLDELKSGKVNRYINVLGKSLMKGISDTLNDNRITHHVTGVPAMFQILFNDMCYEYRELKKCELQMYPVMHRELLERGVMIDADIEEPIYLSSSHKKADIQKTIQVYGKACMKACRTLGIK